MAKNKNTATDLPHELGRGTVNHSALGALVTSKLFRCKAEAVKKGKGSYKRKGKHKGKEPFQSPLNVIFGKVFFNQPTVAFNDNTAKSELKTRKPYNILPLLQ